VVSFFKYRQYIIIAPVIQRNFLYIFLLYFIVLFLIYFSYILRFIYGNYEGYIQVVLFFKYCQYLNEFEQEFIDAVT
jgi:hypothetical protein